MKWRVRILNLFAKIHWLILAFVYGCLVVKAFCQLNPSWDYLTYRLPNALSMIGWIQFIPTEFLRIVMETYPPLGDLVQGLLVLVTGKITAASGANVVVLLLTLGLICLLYGRAFSWRWLLTSFLAIPLFVFHLPSGYTDLFGACGILLAFTALMKLEEYFEIAATCFCLGLFIATMSRFTLWPAAGFLWIAAGLKILKLSGQSVRAKSIFLASALVLISIWPARNFMTYGSPIYPYRAPFVGKYFPFHQDFIVDTLRPKQLAHQLQAKPPIQSFLVSLFELNRFGGYKEKYSWNLDQGQQGGVQNPHFRLGGWSIFTVLIFLGYLIMAINWRLISFYEISMIAVFLVFTSFLPQGHELRYFLFIPLCIAFSLARVLPMMPKYWGLVFKVLILASAAYVVEKAQFKKFDFGSITNYASPRIKNAWQAYDKALVKKPLCGEDGNPASIFYAGPTLREYPVVDRDREHCKGVFYDP